MKLGLLEVIKFLKSKQNKLVFDMTDSLPFGNRAIAFIVVQT